MPRAAAQAQPGPHRDAAPSESNRVSERHQRSAGARHRRQRRSCRPTRAAMGSTTSPSATCRRRCLDRYISAAQKVSRLAIGSTQTSMQADVIRLPADRTQETHVAGLPLGTRGGVSIPYTFAQDGEYEIQVWLARDLSGNVGGLARTQPFARDGRARRPRAGEDLHHSEARRRRHDAGQRFAACASPSARARTTSASRSSMTARRCWKRNGNRCWRASTSGVIRARPRRRSGVGERTVCGQRRQRHAEPPPHFRVPA